MPCTSSCRCASDLRLCTTVPAEGAAGYPGNLSNDPRTSRLPWAFATWPVWTMAPGPGINLIVGANGSGKTSLLEGIHILGMGRSFRTQQLKHAIAHDGHAMTLHGRGWPATRPLSIGMRRQRDSRSSRCVMAGERVARLSAGRSAPAAADQPRCLSFAGRFSLIGRREFLDWGVFHVEHDFLDAWRRVRRALKHRNALLRRGRI